MKFNRQKVAAFQDQDCQLTLREALAEFYTVNLELFCVPEPATPWTQLLVHHDVGHVFFGVNTSILDETAGDYWTLFATDLSVKEYLSYLNTPQAKKLIKQIGFITIVKSIVCGLPLLLRVYQNSRKMNRKWQTKGYQPYMDMPLGKLRKLFDLEILDYQ
ncbi:MAG: hypothetical protein OFPI_07540 [Osedax symbiont Rs2]|nr:MAG: hypothetical protein OFPI_07540 [Osedax symbiont Rs2]